jgi:ornithine--oxo-acid transaminase
MLYPNLDVSEMFVDRQAQRSAMHVRHLNEQLVRVLKTIGYDVGFQSGHGQYLFDRDGARYLDLLSGFGVFAIGRNHPALREALKSVLDSNLPNLVQMDVSTLAGVLAERLLEQVPYLDKVFFANSGAECVEAAIKFARVATVRPGIVYCGHGYHGLSYGALSLTDDENFRGGFEPLLPGCTVVPFNDLAALEQALSSRQVAAFIVEPIQGKGVNMPTDEFLPAAAALCKRYGTLFIADEIQTGMGRTGRFLAVEHWNVEPDMVLLAKALSGGHVPVGAVLTRKHIFDKIFNRMDRAVVHGSTFAKNDLAMAAGIATLEVMKAEKLIENAARRGAELRLALTRMVSGYELLKEVRGKGLMIGVEFGPPKSLRLRAAWNLLETANKGLFCQLITVPLFKDHKILTQVSGHGSHTIKLLPPLIINDEDCKWVETSFDSVIAASHQVPGAIWSLGKTLMDNAFRKSA